MPNQKITRVTPAQYYNHLWKEHHLVLSHLSQNGLINFSIVKAGLEKFVSATPTHFLPDVVFDFYLYLNRETRDSKVYLRDVLVPGKMATTSSRDVTVAHIADQFDLGEIGPDPEEAGSKNITDEFRRFAEDPSQSWSKNAKVKDLRQPFRAMAEIVTKCFCSFTGGHAALPEGKIRLISALCAAAEGRHFDWHSWFENQLLACHKDVKTTDDPMMLEMSQRFVKYGTKLSYAFEKLFPEQHWSSKVPFNKKPLFGENFDAVFAAVPVPPPAPTPVAEFLVDEEEEEDVVPLTRKRKNPRAAAAAKKQRISSSKSSKTSSLPSSPESTEVLRDLLSKKKRKSTGSSDPAPDEVSSSRTPSLEREADISAPSPAPESAAPRTAAAVEEVEEMPEEMFQFEPA